MKVNHIGIAVYHIELIKNEYLNLGYKPEGDKIKDLDRNLWIQFLVNDYGHRIELIETLNENIKSPIDSFLDKNIKQKIYHICYEVDSLESKMEELIRLKYIVINQPAKAIAFLNKRVCFMYHKNMGIIELLEV